MALPNRQVYEFGGFRFDALRNSLELLSGEPIPLKPKACEILRVLVEQQGRTISKEELMKTVWPDAFVEEGNLMVNMSQLRKALGDNTDQAKFIVTQSGKGYRFVAPVTVDPNSDLKKTEARDGRFSLSGGNRRLYYFLAAVVFAGAVAALFLSGWVSRMYRNRSLDMGSANVRLTKLTTSGNVRNAAISPDGKYVAYAIGSVGEQAIWLRQISAGTDVQIVAPAADTAFSGLNFSADGERIYYLRHDKSQVTSLVRSSTLGGAGEKLAEDVDSSPANSPDGKWIAFLRGLPNENETALFLIGLDGQTRRVATLPSTEGFIISFRPIWMPDSGRIICGARRRDEKGKYDGLVSVDPESGSIEPINMPRFSQIVQGAWSRDPNGLILAAANEESPSLSQIWQVTLREGQANRVTNDLNDYRDLSVTADGRSLVTIITDLQTNIWTIPELDFDRARQVTSTNYDGANGLTFMPDGRILFASKVGSNFDLFLMETDGKRRQLTSNSGNNIYPDVSPDGMFIAFVSNRNGNQHIWVMKSDGSGARQLTNGIDDGRPNWSPDGKAILFRSYVNGNPLLLKIPFEGGEPIRLTESITGMGIFSPNGDKILYTFRAEALTPLKLAILLANGGEPERIFDLRPTAFRWARDAQAFLYVNQFSDRGTNLWRQPLDPTSPPSQLTQWKDQRIYGFDTSPDGKTVACARGESQSDVVLINSAAEQK